VIRLTFLRCSLRCTFNGFARSLILESKFQRGQHRSLSPLSFLLASSAPTSIAFSVLLRFSFRLVPGYSDHSSYLHSCFLLHIHSLIFSVTALSSDALRFVLGLIVFPAILSVFVSSMSDRPSRLVSAVQVRVIDSFVAFLFPFANVCSSGSGIEPGPLFFRLFLF